MEQCFGETSQTEQKRQELEETGNWRTHPTFSDYLGSRDGEVFSLKSLRVINGQKKGKYGFIAMYLVLNNDDVYVTQHRFIYECFNGLLRGRSELTHCNGVESDNTLDNLKVITEQEETRGFDSTKKHPHPIHSKYGADVHGTIFVLKTGKALNYQPNKAGYIELQLTVQGKSVPYAAHRLVYESFHGLLDGSLQVDHHNEAKADNRILNLTALEIRAHTKKIRQDNPQMSLKRAATCSKAVLRIKVDEDGNTTQRIRYTSAKLAAAADDIECNVQGIRDAIKDQRAYKGFLWEYESYPDLSDETWKTFVDDDGFQVVFQAQGGFEPRMEYLMDMIMGSDTCVWVLESTGNTRYTFLCALPFMAYLRQT